MQIWNAPAFGQVNTSTNEIDTDEANSRDGQANSGHSCACPEGVACDCSTSAESGHNTPRDRRLDDLEEQLPGEANHSLYLLPRRLQDGWNQFHAKFDNLQCYPHQCWHEQADVVPHSCNRKPFLSIQTRERQRTVRAVSFRGNVTWGPHGERLAFTFLLKRLL